MSQHPHLGAVQRAVGDGDPQHIGVELQVEPVLEPDRLELLFGDLAGKAPLALLADSAVRSASISVSMMSYWYMNAYFRRIRSTRPLDRAAPTAWLSRSTSAPPRACLPWSGLFVGPSARRRSR